MSRAEQMESTAVVAVDTGGTFTDFLLLKGGELRTLKLPSTPRDPAEAVLEGCRRLVPEGEPFVLLHGSTVATNALLERKGARVVLITNSGFEDVIEIGRQNRPQLYALVGHRLPPLVAREDRIGVAGRIGPRGEEIQPLDEAELASLASRVEGAASVAVCLLHSYANPEHEHRVAQALAGGRTVERAGSSGAGRASEAGEAGALEPSSSAAAPLSISCELLPEYREYERTSTTVVNAYVAPVISRYLGRLDRESHALRTSIMGSGGGTLPVARAVRSPAHTVLSGPAGGAVGALEWGKRAGHDHVIGFDMGGTSTDVCLCPGRLLHTREFEIAGQPVALPVIDIHTVGAGGGSLARVDPGGLLRVGPESAGADPGPICYGRGGTQVTVTDAHVWLGRLPVGAFLGGEGRLDRARVQAPLAALASALGGSLEDAAEGVIAVADSAMERALRVISVERGYDPIAFSVVAFGGAGGLHVAELASRLGAAKALVPPDPGLLSAWGILAAPLTRDASRTVLIDASREGADATVAGVLAELEQSAKEALLEEGAAPGDVSISRLVDARYRGQSFELQVPAEGWTQAFHTSHESRYGYSRRGTPVEAVTLRAVARVPGPTLEAAPLPVASGPPPASSATVRFGGEDLQAALVWRKDLRAGHEIEGPVVVQEYSATTWVPPEWGLTVDPWGTLHLSPPRITLRG